MLQLVVTVSLLLQQMSLSVSAVPKDASLFPTFLLVPWEGIHLSSMLGSLGVLMPTIYGEEFL